MALDAGSMAFMMVSAALVLFMTPGLAFFYGGMVSEGGVVTLMAQSFVAMGVVSLWWWFVGFSLCFGESWGVIGNPGTYIGLTNVNAVENLHINGQFIDAIPGVVYSMFQLTFAIITPALMTGGFVERLRFKPFIIFVLLWATLVYAPFAHLSWGGGLFYQWGVWDFAGGTVVHITSGWSALGSVLALGRRKHTPHDHEEKPHSVPFILLGTAILWFGWFGFNGGSALVSNGVASMAYLNTHMAAAAALWAWVLIDWLLKGKPSLVGACVGAVAGLVVITPMAGYVQPWAAIVAGLMVSIVCQFTCELRQHCCLHWLDDTLDVWGTHGMGGFLGAVLVGVLSDPAECNPGKDSGITTPAWCAFPNSVSRSWLQLNKQLAAAVICAVYSAVTTFVLLKLLSLFMQLKPELEGPHDSVDEKEQHEVAYHSPTQAYFKGGAAVQQHGEHSPVKAYVGGGGAPANQQGGGAAKTTLPHLLAAEAATSDDRVAGGAKKAKETGSADPVASAV